MKLNAIGMMDLSALTDTIRALLLAVDDAIPLRILAISIAAIVGATLVGHVVGRRLERDLEGRVRAIHGRPRLLRVVAVLLRRLPAAGAALALWTASLVLREVPAVGDLPLVRTAAVLATAWVVIRTVARVVRNRFAARAVAVIGWTLVALDTIGLLDPIADELDDRAIMLGSLRLSVLAALKAIAWFSVLLWFAGMVGGGAERWLRQSTDLTPGLQVLIGKLVRIGLFVLAVLVSLSVVGLDLSTLTVITGALGLGIGFGLQTVVSNFISGIIILADKSIKPGDVVSVGGTVGWIRSLKARFVSVVTRDGHEILVPNEDFITEKVINWSYTDTKTRLDVTFGVSYASDPHQVRALAREAAVGVPRVLDAPKPVCHITGFGDSSIDFVVRFWIDDAQNGLTNVRGDVYLALWDALKAADIEIPFPQRDIHVRTLPRGAALPD